MRYIFTLLLVCCALGSQAAEAWENVFNWKSPLTLTPPFSPATADNRSGEFVGGVEFKGGNCTFYIDDNGIKEKSQSARFYYGYLTQTNELRVYPGSSIVIKASDRQAIKSIAFEGAKVGADYLEAETAGTWSDGVWTPGKAGQTEVKFDVLATINCTVTSVSGAEWDSVDDISADSDGEAVSWTDLQGRTYTARPQTAGIYICRYASGKVARELIK